VDDQPLMRGGIAAVLRGEPDIALVGEAASGCEAIERYRVLRPDVTLMDLQMSGIKGIEAISAILQEFSGAKFIVLTE
jgi:DNA-binding NarL/FixJ family response regulator